MTFIDPPKSDGRLIAEVMENVFTSGGYHDELEGASVTDALYAIAAAIEEVAQALFKLGTNDASSSMGALELVAKEIHDAARNGGWD